jgi:hypothetical protein
MLRLHMIARLPQIRLLYHDMTAAINARDPVHLVLVATLVRLLVETVETAPPEVKWSLVRHVTDAMSAVGK